MSYVAAQRMVGTSNTLCRARNPVKIAIGDGQVPAEFLGFDGLEGGEHIAIRVPGRSSDPSQPILVRLHSECLTGDVFGSARCDCGQQLHEALAQMAEEGGVLLYLRQEGRGIGLYAKLEAYRLQDRGIDTYAANRELNLPEDARDFGLAAQMLFALNIDRIRLLTNNPEKVSQLRAAGINIAAIRQTSVFVTDSNRAYLQAKLAHRHMLDPRLLSVPVPDGLAATTETALAKVLPHG
ncbi:GTP cyclohydrolase II [Acidisoma cellulosilytica]|uniref:GTP cyclohydrolase II n=1 Tax=Acidisoma cellulosilyticum TaxID=2802395 RepID=A0A963Z6U2_9PROT|nr:GTP cyclohydrolase II [Acidisoma cellulosilyticum]MCB8883641.1 GTP cyclohydrolase II [Acidisoma cellulosilyticum]